MGDGAAVKGERAQPQQAGEQVRARGEDGSHEDHAQQEAVAYNQPHVHTTFTTRARESARVLIG